MLNMIESGGRSKKGSIGLANTKGNHTIDVFDKQVDHLINGGA